jgi:hypothetical protein
MESFNKAVYEFLYFNSNVNTKVHHLVKYL